MGLISRSLISVIVTLFMFSGVCFSAEPESSKVVSQEETKTTDNGPTAAKEPATKVGGKITFIEPDGSLVVMSPSGKAQIVYIRNGSKIVKKDCEISRNDLKVGDVIDASVDSMRKAKRVEVIDQAP